MPRIIDLSDLPFEVQSALVKLHTALRLHLPDTVTGAQVTFNQLRSLDSPPTVDIRVLGAL